MSSSEMFNLWTHLCFFFKKAVAEFHILIARSLSFSGPSLLMDSYRHFVECQFILLAYMTNWICCFPAVMSFR